MSDKPRLWPNVAISARDRSAEAAVHGIRMLAPVVDPERLMTDSEKLLRASAALNDLQTIARLLESVGAPTRP